MLLLGSATDSSARYWVGGTGVWNSIDTTNWSYYSGGPGGAPVPTSVNNVYFDANSDVGSDFIVTLTTGTANIFCKSLIINTQYKVSFIKQDSLIASILIYGGLILPADTSKVDLYSDYYLCRWVNLSFTNNNNEDIQIITHENIIGSDLGFYNTGRYLIQTNLNMRSEYAKGYLSIDLAPGGTFTINSTIYASYIEILGGVIDFQTSDIYTSTLDTYTSGVTLLQTLAKWRFDCWDYFAGLYSQHNNLTNVYFHTDYIDRHPELLIQKYGGSLTITNLYLYGPPVPGISVISVSNSITISNLNIIDTAPNRRILINGTDFPSSLAINSVINMVDVDFTNMIITGAAAPISGTRVRRIKLYYDTSDVGSGVTTSINTPRTLYWNKPIGGSIFEESFSLTPGGSPSGNNFPMFEDTIVIQDTGLDENGIINFGPPLGTGDAYYVNKINVIDLSSRTKPLTIDDLDNNTIALETINYPTSSSTLNIPVVIIFTRSSNTQISFYPQFLNNLQFLQVSDSSNLLLMEDLNADLYIASGQFDANNFNIKNGFNILDGQVYARSGIWTSLINNPISNLGKIVDPEKMNISFKPSYISSSITFPTVLGNKDNSLTIQINSLIINPQTQLIPPEFVINKLIPKSIEYISNFDQQYTIRFRHDSTEKVWEINKFNLNGGVSTSAQIFGAPTKLNYIGRNSVILNRVNINGIRVYPENTWYATNSTGNDYGWIFNAPPLLTAVDSDNIVTAGQSNVTLTGTSLSVIDGIQLRQGNAILNATNYTPGASPTFTLPDLSSIFSSGIKFGPVQLDIMENNIVIPGD